MHKLLIIILLKLASQATAQQVKIEVEPQQPRAGEAFQLKIILENEDGELIALPSLGGLQKLSGPNPEFFTSISNGRVTKRISWTLVLRATAEGNFQIGQAKVKVGRTVQASQPFAISIKSNTYVAPSGKTGKEDIFVNLELTSENAFVGQQVIGNFVLYDAVGAESFELFEDPKFDGFFVRDLQRQGNRARQVTVGKRQYVARVLKSVALFPQKTGKLSIPPARFSIAVPVDGKSDDPFANFFGRPTRQIPIETEAVSLDVRPLPEPSPADFTGGVGNYDWKISTDRTELSTDEALTLRINLRGNGDAQRFSMPNLRLPEGLEAFEPKIVEEESYESIEQIEHTKTVEIAVLPRQAGEFELDPRLVFFSPDSNRYVSLGSPNPLKIKVLQGKNSSKINAQPNGGGQLSPLRTTADWQARDSQWVFKPAFWLVLLLPFLALLFVFLKKNWDEKRAARVAASPELQAKFQSENLQRRLAECQNLADRGEARQFYDSLEKLLAEFLGKKLGIAAADFSQKTVFEKLAAEPKLPSDLLENLREVFRLCEISRFAGLADGSKMASVLSAVRAVFQSFLI